MRAFVPPSLRAFPPLHFPPMAAQIHPTAILEGDVQLADDVVIGPHCVLNGPVTIAAGTRLIGNVYLQGPLTLGERNVIYPFACLGFAPQHAKYDPQKPGLGTVIGSGNTFREHVTIHRAYTEDGPTRVGDNNYFMVNSHVGHDSIVGDNNTFVNNVALGGHVVLHDRVLLGGNSGVHQFCRIGTGAMLAAGTITTLDVPPWFMLTGTNMCGSVNLIGLRRNGFTSDLIGDVRWVHRTLCRSGLPVTTALERMRERIDSPIVADYVRFIESSKRGVCTGRARQIRGGNVGSSDTDAPN